VKASCVQKGVDRTLGNLGLKALWVVPLSTSNSRYIIAVVEVCVVGVCPVTKPIAMLSVAIWLTACPMAMTGKVNFKFIRTTENERVLSLSKPVRFRTLYRQTFASFFVFPWVV
jgi:hypothetical protein